MGKHEAADGQSAHPIVAAALAARPGEAGGAHFAGAAGRAAGENPVGWPGAPAPGGGGLGWPADADTPDTGGDTDDAVPTATTDGPDAPVVRRTWRRLFSAGRVA